MQPVVVAVAEQADAELLVVEQEAAKIVLERLDTDPDRVEIVAVRDIAQVIVDEGFLHPEELVVAVAGLGRLDEQHPLFGYVDVVGVERERQAVLDLGGLERGAALDQRGTGDEGLAENIAGIPPEHVEALPALGGLDADRDREGARLDHRVAGQAADEEPVVAVDRQPRHLGAVYRAIALERILVIGIPPALLDQPERLDQPPAVGHRELVGREGLRRRGADRAGVVLRHRIGERRDVAGAAAAFDAFGIEGRRGGFLGLCRQLRFG